jgi:hypothetical protein
MTARRRIGVLGTFGSLPFAGMAWMHCQFLVGLARLGHEVFYVETTDAWPYDQANSVPTTDPAYTLSYLQQVLDGFGLGDRWMYRATYSDGGWHGPLAAYAPELLSSADAVLNISGSTIPHTIGMECRLVHIGTDPVVQELRVAKGDLEVRERLAAHVAHFTYGENIGKPECPVPPLPFPCETMRQPVVLDYWTSGPPPRRDYTTVTNWEMGGYDCEYNGEVYTWSKHHEYLKFIDLPKLTTAGFELAMPLGAASREVQDFLHEKGWKVVDATRLSDNPWSYREYIRNSGAEFTVAKDMNVRLRSGWFSERSACYLAAGRPVVTQDTGFGTVLPTGEGLFAFRNMEDILSAVDAIESDYDRHSRAARAIAEEHFKAEVVLTRLLDKLGL